ncbi:hypothetical protein BLA29_014786 [Euroglyphus maynei]|uniref:Uncharacterized protein n=1 Tax=Euroglyphus maynei TaxID=6958 RepID=A0A1Y3BTD9_EURMA|nr:hypothetical protein BLA29_014786 [Euroglyphus maynei]
MTLYGSINRINHGRIDRLRMMVNRHRLNWLPYL